MSRYKNINFKNCCIYKIQCKINNKFYIGSTTNKYKRYYQHLYKLRKNIHENIHLQNSFNKYGENNFSYFILKDLLLNDNLNCKEVVKILEKEEQKYIDELKPEYNVCKVAGNTLGYKYSLEQRAKLSLLKRKIEITKENINICIQELIENKRGKIKTTQKNVYKLKTKIIVKNKIKIIPKSKIIVKDKVIRKRFITKFKPILQFSLNNEFIKNWDSITDAANFYKIGKNAIIGCCKNKRKTCKGYIWKYKDNTIKI